MRTTAGAINRYAAGQVPNDPQALVQFLRDELYRIQLALSVIADGQLDETTVAPAKPRAGMIRYGTAGTLGVAAGFYGYHSGAWNLLG